MQAQSDNGKAARTDRVSRLRERIINEPRKACVERARYFTKAYADHYNEHPKIRFSTAFANVLDNISVIIRDDELVVGCRTSKLKGAPFFPENKIRWIENDADSLTERHLQRVEIEDDEARELIEQIAPFWRGKAVEDILGERMPEDVAEDMDRYIFTMVLEITYGVGHFTCDHNRVLSLGLRGIINETKKRLDSVPESDSETRIFYEAVVVSLEAAIRFAHRYSDLAAKLAAAETDPVRAAELAEISRICAVVPEHPATSFAEAVQAVYFVHLLTQIESGGNSISLGRIDQYLYPFFRTDIESGKITEESARELLSLLYLKTNEIWNILEEAFIPGGEGTEGKTTQNLTIGGVGRNGQDATNLLSFIALDAYADVRTVQPNVSVRISPGRPGEFFKKASAYAADGVLLHLLNDGPIIDALVRAGHSLEDARDFGVVGCLEPNAQGKTYGSTFAVQISGIKCLELALNNGVDNIFGFAAGPETGAPEDIKSFEELFGAYDKQLRHFVGQMQRGMEILDRTIAEFVPSPLASAVLDGPLEKGKDLTEGGAIYNSTGAQLIGFANTADSLYAIKKAVFEQGLFTMEEVAELLADDWYDAEEARSYFRHKLDKYGNDKDEVDEMAARVFAHYCNVVGSLDNYRGGKFWPGIFSVGFHIAMGSFAAASADGRNAGDVLGNGITPTNGNALSGPTAVMNSVTKLPLHLAPNGVNLNLRFNPATLKPELLAALVGGYFDKGGVQVQFNIVDAEVLKQAKIVPDKYRDLVVRVSGYSALFTGLSETAQDEIISRTEYEISGI